MKTTDSSATYDGACEKAVFSLRSSTLWHAYTVWYCFLKGSGLIRYGSGKDIYIE